MGRWPVSGKEAQTVMSTMKRFAGIFPAIISIMIFVTTSAAEEEQHLSAIALKTKMIVEATYKYTEEHSENMDTVQYAIQHDPRFLDIDNELYIFIHCYDVQKREAVCCGQAVRPELIGKNMWSLRTPNGRLLFYEIAQMIERDGEGWIEYDWLNPYSNRIQTKRSYVKGIILKDGRKAWIGSGYWK